MASLELVDFIRGSVERQVAEADTIIGHREPLVGFVPADDPRFAELRQVVEPTHMLPEELLPGARTVVSFFLPFKRLALKANAKQREAVAREWAVAYVETNNLIGQITDHLVRSLAEQGVRAATEPATYNFDPETLVSRWSHKSVAVIAGLGSFGLHHLVITDAGCAGRFGSLVIDAALPVAPAPPKVRCLYFHDGSCRVCVERCPIGALDETGRIDKQRCWQRCLEVGQIFKHIGPTEICGKCSIGPCAFRSAV